MRNPIPLCPILIVLLAIVASVYPISSSSQTAPETNVITSKTLSSIESKYQSIEQGLDKASNKLLKRMLRLEAHLHKQMVGKDSSYDAGYANALSKYASLQQQTSGSIPVSKLNGLKEYIPGLDSIHTAMRYLDQLKGKLPAGQLEKITAINTQLSSLESKLQQANNIKAFLKERQQQLKSELEKLNLGKQLQSFNKEAYYYSQRLQEYKALVSDRKKLEEKALAALRDLPAFKNFMQKNSYLSQLFPMPGNYGTAQALAGLQTRAQVGSIVNERMGRGATAPDAQAPDASTMMQAQVQAAQNELNALKDKVNKLGGGSSDAEVPDFKPNNQKTKSIWKRLEYGCNLQTAGTSGLLPATMDLGLSLGYKLNDKSVIGIGGSYKLGLGKPVSHMELSSQGIGLRSFLDIKLKGSIWISGGYEYNYQQAFKDLSTIQHLDVWQKSGLIGLTKKFKAGKKDGKLQVLWDFLSYSQVPRAQALKFRIGYNF
ncbi:MAG: hypothetical protein J0I41_00030 [Filimonas sp.]|nr:hypothetical protein [Filimonas sp.]